MNIPDNIEDLRNLLLSCLEKLSSLEAENALLKAENAELRARLGINSSNSHQPPSRDIYKKPANFGGSTSSKNKGGQQGHEGNTLKMIDVADKIMVHKAASCSCCGRIFGEDEVFSLVQKRQVFDLPTPRLEVTEHQLVAITCCSKQHLGNFPTSVPSPTSYGEKVLSFASLLSVGYQMPYEKISQLFEDLYGSSLNVSTIISGNAKLYANLASIEAEIKQAVTQSDIVHFDETGMRVEGKQAWFHTACSDLFCYLFVHEKRGKKALVDTASVLPDFKNWAIHDCWSSYFNFKDCRHAICNAHILRELQSLMDHHSSFWAQEMHNFLLELYEIRTKSALIVPDRASWYKKYELICAKADEEEPPPIKNAKGKPKNSKGRNLLHRLKTYQTGVLAFAFEEGVPFTNNVAENDIRNIKIKQKVAMSFRTMEGAKIYARIQGCLKTFKKNGLNLFQTIVQVNQKQQLTLLTNLTT